ncbi:pyridoxamine 5'-phosphate oxidase family protein [Sphingomonas nostoxanthinifaciens]|uniref:pyridoxamine 5'-phosphate oxidase family protein n=1 Tax=Sphingomonas nostoxanthinifaciens TaxID=2872652 RepID=UPI001CC1D47C|nr:pyridoxamine 5'-phosphate oxidase family protein [Sphingomonas nostoxanthinifaciens]UAK24627.1 pyridoxamine 5'-phosphate oxidase family protein [Sphingomonas nostoxanthinifaciens]
MPTDTEIESLFWKELKSAPFVMLGLVGARDGHTQPMTAQFDGESGPLYFFLAKDNSLIAGLNESDRAIAAYASKGHDVFAAIHGRLAQETDPAVIDRLWNPHVEAWFEGGRNDPKLALLRLDTERAELWKGGSSFGAAITRLFGADPKESYKDNVAEVAL